MDANRRARAFGQHADYLSPARARLRPDGVVDASAIPFGKVDEPWTEIADIDPLQRPRAIRRPEHVAAARDPIDPVREAIGVVAGPDYVSRSDDGGGFTQDLTHRAVAVRFQRTVVRPAHFLGRCWAPRQWCRFDDPLRGGRVIHRGRGHEQVPPDATLEKLRGIAHVPRNVARVVDHRVPSTLACERGQAPVDFRVAVADQCLDAIAVHPRAAPAPVEHRDAMTACERVLDLVRPKEARAAEDEQI